VKWKQLDRNSPEDGSICVVGHFLPNASKPLVGLWKFCYFDNSSYWLTRSGDKIDCSNTDNWCDVEDIISAVEDKLVEDIKFELSRPR
jgi:hypothetical protein